MIAIAEQLEVVRPRRLKEALVALAEAAGAGAPLTPMAGGTDLFVGLNAGAPSPSRYLDLWRLDELRGIERDGRRLRFGALTTFSDCIRSHAVEKLLPILVAAAREVGGVQIQNRGTLAGNIGNGSPAADGVPVLLAAEAQVILASTQGERAVPLADFYTGYRKTVRRPDELIARIELTAQKGEQRFRKVGTRAAQAISKVVLAATGLGGKTPRIALGSVAPTVVRARKLESFLAAGGRDEDGAARAILEDVRPIDDVRSTAEYRTRVCANLARELVRGI
ncbi:MAG TPA: FAD binding domain-containing protein [Polyangia bacterium]|jgi:CO/xanthine dehydrogenase FAD-binding subunit